MPPLGPHPSHQPHSLQLQDGEQSFIRSSISPPLWRKGWGERTSILSYLVLSLHLFPSRSVGSPTPTCCFQLRQNSLASRSIHKELLAGPWEGTIRPGNCLPAWMHVTFYQHMQHICIYSTAAEDFYSPVIKLHTDQSVFKISVPVPNGPQEKTVQKKASQISQWKCSIKCKKVRV